MWSFVSKARVSVTSTSAPGTGRQLISSTKCEMQLLIHVLVSYPCGALLSKAVRLLFSMLLLCRVWSIPVYEIVPQTDPHKRAYSLRDKSRRMIAGNALTWGPQLSSRPRRCC